MQNRDQISKSLLNKWYSKLDKEEVTQEELIQVWQNPDLEGYQGLLAFNELFYKEYKEKKINVKTVPLKKNTPAKEAGVDLLARHIVDIINSFDISIRGRISILIQPILNEIYYGKNLYSIRRLSKELNITKSSLARLIKEVRTQLSSSSSSSSLDQLD